MARIQKSNFAYGGVPDWALNDAARLPIRNDTKKLELGKSGLLQIGEAAANLNVSEKTVRRLIKAGTLKALRIGRLLRIKNTEIERFIAAAAATGGPSPKITEEDDNE